MKMNIASNPSKNNNLPTFKDSPAIKWFGHLIPEDGIVDAKDVRILWNTSMLEGDGAYAPGTTRIHDMAVFYWPKDHVRNNENLCNWMYRFDDPFRCSSGNVYADWNEAHMEMLDDLWSDFNELGFMSDAEALRARKEFARMRQCEWARDPNYPTPRGTPWTAEDHQTLAMEVARAEKRREERGESKFNPNVYTAKDWLKKDVSTTPPPAMSDRIWISGNDIKPVLTKAASE